MTTFGQAWVGDNTVAAANIGYVAPATNTYVPNNVIPNNTWWQTTPQPCPTCHRCPTCGSYRWPNTWTGSATWTANPNTVAAAPSIDLSKIAQAPRANPLINPTVMDQMKATQYTATNGVNVSSGKLDASACPSADASDGDCEHD